MSSASSDRSATVIRLACTACQEVFKTSTEMLGKPVRCPACEEFLIAPKTRFGQHVVVGDFVLGEVIAHGGMGVVFKGYQRSLDRSCAVKVLHAHHNDDFDDNLMREARLGAKLNHPNMIQCYAVGQEHGVYYYAMEYVQGKTLRQMLNDRWKLSPSQALLIGRQVVYALDFAWKRSRLVHRDIKPENIMVTEDGTVKLADFGLARPVAELEEEGKEFMRGSPHFMCPEVVLGSEMDYRGDMYSLGAVLYMAVTGKYPLVGDSPESTAMKQVDEYPVSPSVHTPDLPHKVCDLIEQMMEKEPDNRFADFETLLSRLDEALAACPETTVTGGTTTVNLFRAPGGTRTTVPAPPPTTANGTPKSQLRMVRPPEEPEPAPEHVIPEELPSEEPVTDNRRGLSRILMVLGLFIVIGCGVLWAYQEQVRALVMPRPSLSVPGKVASKAPAPPAPVTRWQRSAPTLDERLPAYAPVGVKGELVLQLSAELKPLVSAFQAVEPDIQVRVVQQGDDSLLLAAERPSQSLVAGLGAFALYAHPENPLVASGVSSEAVAQLLRQDSSAPQPVPVYGDVGVGGEWAGHLVETTGLTDDALPSRLLSNSLLDGQLPRRSLQAVGHTSAISEVLADEPHAIAFGEPGYADESMAMVPVDGAGPDTWRSVLLSQGHPTGCLVVLQLKQAQPPQLALARYLVSREGQQAVAAAGFMPLTGPEAVGGWLASPWCDVRRQAESAWTEVKDASPEHGVGPLLAQARAQADQTAKLLAGEDAVAALAALGDLHRQAVLVRQQISRRQQALAAKATTEELAKAASQAEADARAPEAFGQGFAQARQAGSSLDRQDLQAAREYFQQASRYYGEALVQAADLAFQEQVDAQTIAILRDHGGQAWQALQVHLTAAEKAAADGRYMEAAQGWSKAGQEIGPVRRKTAQDLLATVSKFADQGQVPVAIALLEKALILEPEQAEARQLWTRLRSNFGFTPGEVLTNPIGMRFAYIPAGSFQMGSSENEPSRDQDEILHRVTLSHGFFMGIYEVSQYEWDQVMGKNYKPVQGVHPNDLERGFTAPMMPKHTITWEEAQLFCERLTRQTGIPHRLPTEAEWEYACRAGTTTGYHLGATQLRAGQANVYLPTGTSSDGPMAVGSFEYPNAWGLYDMHGNVWEWCADWLGPYPETAAVDPTGPVDPGRLDLAKRVLRGGSWYDDADKARSANRWGNTPSVGANYIGFRVVMEAARVER